MRDSYTYEKIKLFHVMKVYQNLWNIGVNLHCSETESFPPQALKVFKKCIWKTWLIVFV